MRAERLGELLITQVCSGLSEREADDGHPLGLIYWLAQILRGKHVREQEVELKGGEVSFSHVADAVEKLDFSGVPEYWKDYPPQGIERLRRAGHSGPESSILKLNADTVAEVLQVPLE